MISDIEKRINDIETGKESVSDEYKEGILEMLNEQLKQLKLLQEDCAADPGGGTTPSGEEDPFTCAIHEDKTHALDADPMELIDEARDKCNAGYHPTPVLSPTGESWVCECVKESAQ